MDNPRIAGDDQYGYMTLRDLFAAFALAGMYASGQLGSGDTADVLAVESYRLADALLQAREGT